MGNSKTNILAINAISSYRILAAPILLLLILKNEFDTFKWLLVVSFVTDAVDGYLARRYKAVSNLGARLDSAGDDLTVIAAIIGMIKWNYPFIDNYKIWAAFLLLLLIIQVTLALIRYGKMTAFHTYISKTAAISQAAFLSSSFLIEHPSPILFYITAVITAIGLLEEIAMTILLEEYRVDIKGLYWLSKNKKS